MENILFTFRKRMNQNNVNIQLIGPGIWFSIHLLSFQLKNNNEEQEFVENNIFPLIDLFPCEKCKMHAIDFLKNNPIENFYNIKYNGENKGIFIWTWKFHNHVNLRLDKSIQSWEDVFKFYNNLIKDNYQVCSEICKDSK